MSLGGIGHFLIYSVKVKEFHFFSPATPEAVETLARVLPAGTPRDFFDFLRQTDGAEAALDPDWAAGEPDCIRIHSTGLIAELLSTFAERYSDLLIIGSDAATKLVVYDMTQPSPWPIVIFDSDTEEFSSTVQLLAPNMALLRRQFFTNATGNA